ncbi:MAG: polysaccharide export protein EpsE [Leptothrix sp. (in: b-proteobacteria)]
MPSRHDTAARLPAQGASARSTLQRAICTLAGVAALTLAAAVVVPVDAQAQSAALTEARRDYTLGAGDTLRISVYQSQDLTLETRVSESGTISFPLLGTIKLVGLSVPQAEKTIADGLKNGNFIRQPQVNILLLQIRGNQAAVLGMVNRPGRFPIEVAGMRLSDLVATAGGIAQTGSDSVTLTGLRNGQVMRQQIDLATLLTTGSPDQDPIIQNGDTVYVDRMPMVYIYGEVQRPGPMRLERGMTVLQALASGGGVTVRGTDKGMKLHRRSSNAGQVDVLEPAMTDTVREGDVIYVRQSLF